MGNYHSIKLHKIKYIQTLLSICSTTVFHKLFKAKLLYDSSFWKNEYKLRVTSKGQLVQLPAQNSDSFKVRSS